MLKSKLVILASLKYSATKSSWKLLVVHLVMSLLKSCEDKGTVKRSTCGLWVLLLISYCAAILPSLIRKMPNYLKRLWLEDINLTILGGTIFPIEVHIITFPSLTHTFLAKDFVRKLLVVDTYKRYTALEALDHPFITQLRTLAPTRKEEAVRASDEEVNHNFINLITILVGSNFWRSQDGQQ